MTWTLLSYEEIKQMTDVKKQIESLIAKAEKADKSRDALRFSQAALNAANAMLCLDTAERNQEVDSEE